MVIVKRGYKLIDTEYISEKFGLVEMDITFVEKPPIKETKEYLRQLKKKRNNEQIINDSNNREESI